jgi:hypothetical protein
VQIYPDTCIEGRPPAGTLNLAGGTPQDNYLANSCFDGASFRNEEARCAIPAMFECSSQPSLALVEDFMLRKGLLLEMYFDRLGALQ